MEANIADSSLFTQIDPEAVERHCRRFDLIPEKKLMLAVLTDAIKTVRKPTRRVYCEYVGKQGHQKRQHIMDDTIAWFESEEEEWPFAYRTICGVFGLEPDYLWRGILEGKGDGRMTKRRRKLDKAKKISKTHQRSKTPTKLDVTRCPAIVTRMERRFYDDSISHPVVVPEIIK